MADDPLLPYYERELAFFRQMGAEFAGKYPRIASRLLLESDQSEDPHVERLIQAFAFLTGRIRHKLDDEFPEITESLLSVLYPHYLAPIPSMSIAQFVLDPNQGKVTRGYTLDKGAKLTTRSVNGSPCIFRSCYPVTLWPFEVVNAQFDAPDHIQPTPQAASVLRLELRCLGNVPWSALEIDSVRFFLHGESMLTYGLYELLFTAVSQVQLRPCGERKDTRPVILPPDCLQPVGFQPEEGLLPYTARSFLGYRLLQEYFTFPEKFLFFDVTGLSRHTRSDFTDGIEIVFCLDKQPQLEQPISQDTFRLGCSPVINLFDQIAEPVRLSRTLTEYRVIPDVSQQTTTEVYAVNSVKSVSPHLPEPIEFQPFYSFKHAADREQQDAFWYTARRPSAREGDSGTEVYLSLVDLNFQPTLPATETLRLKITATNRDLPGKLPFGGNAGYKESGNGQGKDKEADYFSLEIQAPVHIRCLRKPTPTARPSLRKGAQWRLISHLSLNYLSLSEGGRDTLREILKLYDFADTSVVRQQIEGIIDVKSRRVVGRPASMAWNGHCRGIEVAIEFDESKYVGSGVFLFASVLEKFLGLYASLNSFSQLIATSSQREEPLKRWPPRAGEQILL